MASYKHIFFDLDHTLWDFETNSKETLSELFYSLKINEKSKFKFDEFFQKYSFYNREMWKFYELGKIDKEELRIKRFEKALLAIGVDDVNISYEIGEQYVLKCPYKTRLIPYSIDVLDYLKEKNYTIHLITNGFSEVQNVKIKNSKIAPYIQHMITSELAGAKKPSIGMFNFAFELTGASSRNSIIIGDSYHSDIVGGMNAGMDTIYFNPHKERFNKKPTFEISCLSELYEIL